MQIQKEILLPNDRPEIVGLKLKINEILDRLDEYLRILRSDVEIMDMREYPPHGTISHSRWKWVEHASNHHLMLYHKANNIWAPTGWRQRAVQE
jgi:hypothetical protein